MTSKLNNKLEGESEKMDTISVLHYDAFTKIKGKGNPAGIVLQGDRYDDKQMQKIALHVGFNETSFVLPSKNTDFCIRFFTPGHEMNLCGHATIATVYALKTKGLLPNKKQLTIETKAGVLPVSIEERDGITYVKMKQVSAQFKSFQGSVAKLAEAIGLNEDEIDKELPILYGSTGVWTLIIPIKALVSFNKMKPCNKMFPEVLSEIPTASIHPFCLETNYEKSSMHGRHFSSPYSGTIEDPVTGTASGVMGAYYSKYIDTDAMKNQIIVEQGQEIGKDGEVVVEVKRQDHVIDVEISGTAVYVDEFTVNLLEK